MASWKSNELTELLGIELPIIQAPMAGSTTPELVATLVAETDEALAGLG